MLTIKFYFLLENIHKTFPYRLIFFSQISFLLFESYQNLNHSDPTQSLHVRMSKEMEIGNNSFFFTIPKDHCQCHHHPCPKNAIACQLDFIVLCVNNGIFYFHFHFHGSAKILHIYITCISHSHGRKYTNPIFCTP
jgi:hypothetical protein